MNSYLTAETSVDAVRTNLKLLRDGTKPGTLLCACVKAECYGHRLELLIDTIGARADMLGVAVPEEAIRVRSLGCKLPVLSFFSACAYNDGNELHDAIEELIVQNITQTVVSIEEVTLLGKTARHIGTDAEVQIKVDSGMNRSGVRAIDAAELLLAAQNELGIKLTGMYTHFACADEADQTFTTQQLATFNRVIEACGDLTGLTIHAANSAATIDMPEAHFDMVRPGLSIYGYQPSEYVKNRLPLQPAFRLTGKLLPVKNVDAGNSCGYGQTYTFDRNSRIGRVPIGYGDGYLRCLSNQAVVRIRGHNAPVRGRVSMDQIIIDVTDVPNAQLGDDVEIISSDPTALNSVENLAKLADTIPYEIVCRLGGRMRHVGIDKF